MRSLSQSGKRTIRQTEIVQSASGEASSDWPLATGY
jgi:hypothetical protein